MSNYKKVQFISWEVHTGPFVVAHQPPETGWYAGLLDPSPDKRTDVLGQCWDIEARLAFTRDAIVKAEAVSDRSTSTLKVFMGPEFLFRGAGGAYLQDLITGWQSAPPEFQLPEPYRGRWPGLFASLRSLVAQAAYEDWVFVFGSALGASFPARVAGKGRYVLDPRQVGEIYNMALFQRGGASHAADTYVSRKHYISGIDFLQWNGALRQHTPNSVRPLDPAALIPADVLGEPEGSAMFRIADINDGNGKPIDFGIEICLDHLCSGGAGVNHFGRLRSAGQFVKIQLVPSGGMSLVPESIRLAPGGPATPRSYAFNCDGLGTLVNTPGSHTQVWNGANGVSPVPQANRLVEANGGAALAGTTTRAVADSVATAHGPVSANMLWNNGNGVQGAGQVRLLAPLDL